MGIEQSPSGATTPSRALLPAGVALMILGILWLIVEFMNVDIGAIFWPWFVIAPGLLLLGWGLVGRGNLGLAIAGSIVTLTGALLFYQSITGHWSSWAYAWALVALGGAALGQVLYGLVTDTPAQLRAGSRLLLISGVIFAAGLLFFEVVIGINGSEFTFWAWPYLLVAVGIALLGYGFLKQRR